MTVPSLPEAFRGVLSEAGSTPEVLAARAEQLQALQDEMTKILEAEHEGADASGRLTVTVTAAGRLRSVSVDGSLRYALRVRDWPRPSPKR